eukprot:363284-Chlamydomonas_euryale.AAC.6
MLPAQPPGTPPCGSQAALPWARPRRAARPGRRPRACTSDGSRRRSTRAIVHDDTPIAVLVRIDVVEGKERGVSALHDGRAAGRAGGAGAREEHDLGSAFGVVLEALRDGRLAKDVAQEEAADVELQGKEPGQGGVREEAAKMELRKRAGDCVRGRGSERAWQ